MNPRLGPVLQGEEALKVTVSTDKAGEWIRQKHRICGRRAEVAERPAVNREAIPALRSTQ